MTRMRLVTDSFPNICSLKAQPTRESQLYIIIQWHGMPHLQLGHPWLPGPQLPEQGALELSLCPPQSSPVLPAPESPPNTGGGGSLARARLCIFTGGSCGFWPGGSSLRKLGDTHLLRNSNISGGSSKSRIDGSGNNCDKWSPFR